MHRVVYIPMNKNILRNNRGVPGGVGIILENGITVETDQTNKSNQLGFKVHIQSKLF